MELYLNLAHSQIVLGYHSEGKKSIDTWDKIGVIIRWRFKESENPEDFTIWINEMKKKIDNMVEIYSSQYFNQFDSNRSIVKK